MTRQPLAFACCGDSLAATLDAADGDTGLLIVSGGNEIRSGAWAGQALLAARVAEAGHPVLRYDRRGVGESEGENLGFRASGDDIATALAAFRAAAPKLRRVVGFGTCDAASALMLFAAELDFASLLLANPWVVEDDDAQSAQAPAALRRRYAVKLADPREWKRLATGAIDLKKLAGGLRRAIGPKVRSKLAAAMREGLERFPGHGTILLSEGDRTAQLFLADWGKRDPRIECFPTASHSFSDEAAREWLFERVLTALRGA